MKHVARILALALAAAVVHAQGGQSPASPSPQAPPWAYPVAAPGAPPPPADDGTPKRVPGSSVALTLPQIRDLFNAPDWHPDKHPPAPEVVIHGRKPDVRACGYCHYPNGHGRPENSSLAGLPAAYIVQQMADFKSGARKGSEPKMGPTNAMIAVGKAATDADVKAAADYFASVPYTKWIRVVETDTVPKMTVSAGLFAAIPGGGTEPLGQRLIEMAEDVTRSDIRDSASGFVAYVPKGSLKRGEALVTAGGGTTERCTVCHGQDLRGLGPVPGIAGRSASYIVRQLFDIKHGSRNGQWSDLMNAAVMNLTLDDMVAIAAYAASRTP